MPLSWQSTYLLVDIGLLLLATSFDGVPADVAMFTALLALWIPGIIDTKTALSGYSNGGLMTVIALFIVVGGVQKLPILSRAAAAAFGKPTNGRIALFKQVCIVALFSTFINNTPLVAFFIPIIVDWCRTYHQNPARYLMPLSYAAIMGDLSVIGTSTNLVVQGLLLQRGLPPMKFFDVAYVGAPAFVVGTLYLVTLGYTLLPGNKPKDSKNRSKSSVKKNTSQAQLADVDRTAADTAGAIDQAVEEVGTTEHGSRHRAGQAHGRSQSAGSTGRAATATPVVVRDGPVAVTSVQRVQATSNGREDDEEDEDEAASAAVDYMAELALQTHSGIIGKPIQLQVSTIFSGEATVLRLIRTGGQAAAQAKVDPSRGDDPQEPSAGPTAPLDTPSDAQASTTAAGRNNEPIIINNVTETEVFQSGDRLLVRASPASILRAYSHQSHYGFHFVATGSSSPAPWNRDTRRYVQLKKGLNGLVNSLQGYLPRSWTGARQGVQNWPATSASSAPRAVGVQAGDGRVNEASDPSSTGGSRQASPAPSATGRHASAGPVSTTAGGNGSMAIPPSSTNLLALEEQHVKAEPRSTRAGSVSVSVTGSEDADSLSPPPRHGFEVILSHSSPAVGKLVSSGALEAIYSVTVLGVRPGAANHQADQFRVSHKQTAAAGAYVALPVREVVPSTPVLERTALVSGPGSANNQGTAVDESPAHSDGVSLMDTEDADAASLRTTTSLLGSAKASSAVASSIGGLTYQAGDSVLIAGPKDFKDTYAPGHRCRDFYVLSSVVDNTAGGTGTGSIEPAGRSQLGSLVILIAMFVVGSIGNIGDVPFEMEKAAMVAAGLNVILGFVSPRQAYKLIQWDLVVLIGSSFGIGAAMDSTGLAKEIAKGIVGMSATAGPHASLFIMYGLTLGLTELISNNAAATLTIPVALNMAKQLNVNPKPFVMAVTIACTAAFALPLGYQTHLMVMQPGGYTQRDFLKVGILMDVIYWATIAGLAPLIWPF